MMQANEPFWAKKRESNGQFYWLPLSQHLTDTKNITGLLWEHWLSEGQRNLISESLNKCEENLGKRLVCFLAAVHDIGKATPAFQSMKGYANSLDLDKVLLEKLERAGFVGISTERLASPQCSRHHIAGQYLLKKYGVEDDIAAIIGGHHGKPIDCDAECTSQIAYEKNYFQSENSKNDIYEKWKKAQQYIFAQAMNSNGFKCVTDLPRIKQPAQVLVSGLLIMADWIASNEMFFPLISVDEEVISDQKRRMEAGFLKWKQEVDYWLPGEISDIEEIYKERFGFAARKIQSVISAEIEMIKNPGIVIIEAPMGSGKTETALVAAEQLAFRTKRSGVFFGLPTQATSDGIFLRIKNWLDSVRKDFGENLDLHLIHGKAYLNEDFLTLAHNINVDDVKNGSIIVNEWFSGKKTAALADFTVGTVDQFLMVALKQRHLALRHLGISKKVVIIDEVHAYDAYMNQYLSKAIQWMGAYGVPVVLLSATLPEERRHALVKSYLQGKGMKWNDVSVCCELDTAAYPLMTYSDGNTVKQISRFSDFDNKNVRIVKMEENRLTELIGSIIVQGGVIGIIVNTVKRAQQLGREFSEQFGEDLIEVLHSGFIETERIKKEKKLLTMIGKNAQRPEKKIIIGTQVIEQSLDIDFDVMISDLAPMDLLIQRIGRLHRHMIKRPKGHKEPVLYVLGASDTLDFERGAAEIYGDYLLARTQYLLTDSINLPQDISPLVQKVYGFNLKTSDNIDLKLLFTYRESYTSFKRKHIYKIQEKERKAKTYRISKPMLKEFSQHKDNLIGWLKNPNPDESEERAYAQVRDTEDTIEVIAIKKAGDGYCFFGDLERDISGKIGDLSMAKTIAKNTLRLPSKLSAVYNIDQTIKELEEYNIKFLREWQESPWLKGSLGIIFDERNEFIINSIKIRYDEKYGVSAERV